MPDPSLPPPHLGSVCILGTPHPPRALPLVWGQVVAPHGAALGFLAFMRPTAACVEVCHSGYINTTNNSPDHYLVF